MFSVKTDDWLNRLDGLNGLGGTLSRCTAVTYSQNEKRKRKRARIAQMQAQKKIFEKCPEFIAILARHNGERDASFFFIKNVCGKVKNA